MELLIVKLGALGDVINTLPLAGLLHDQLGARITWLVEPLSRPLLEGHPAVDRVIVFDKRRWRQSLRPTLQELRQQRFDLILDLQRIWKSGIFTVLARGDRRVGFDRGRCKEQTWLLPLERIAPGDARRHMLEQYLDFARHLGCDTADIRWDLTASAPTPQPLPHRYVAINIGATKEANRWTAEGFAALADGIRERHGLAAVLTGGPEDAGLASDICARAASAPLNLAGRTSIPELCTILHQSQAVVSCDTGPMHLAVAFARPVIALFGPADERRTGPWRGTVVRAPGLDCAPCGKRHCDDPRCMRAITPEMVLAALAQELGD